MKILMVYPRYPETFWSFRHALKFVSKRASFPPLGLLTIAAMLPNEWEIRLLDLNVTSFNQRDLDWADAVYISAMAIQRKSAEELIEKARAAGKTIVAGGPYFTTEYDRISGVDHFVLDEAEITLPLFLADWAAGEAQPVYRSEDKPDITATPLPMWKLLDKAAYSSMSLQYSRGCPFNCEFCDIVVLFGRKPRVKTADQVVRELQSLYDYGWRSGVFFVDDNLIGNKRHLKAEVLPAITSWQEKNKFPFSLSTEVSINLADDDDLMKAMADAGFFQVFVGVETPNAESLAECDKGQNENRDMVAAVKRIQAAGLQVQGGFIVGFDSDPPSIFKSQIAFIQNSGIVTAMVGLLNAPRGTRLFQRLEKENRMIEDFGGDNTDSTLNFEPKMPRKTLIEGYRHLLETIYSPKHYYERTKLFLRNYNPRIRGRLPRFEFHHIAAFFRSLWKLGIIEKGRTYYWRLLAFSLFRRPKVFPLAVTLSITGYHLRKITETLLKTPISGGSSSGSA
ncbi:B12-binding domain-containing radical SAM protein [Dehalogenimonas etheniformans]|uniref:DUF4070 domain-containing protein n=1 Tax=Dehalogenimonas etheniformans TaxID=1536648 RepID=A0A2P5P5R7_9CHLR|nr:B12-binding domain-containing radical SAM protein [Dehalogenimonas etheniformans]PPD57625.1 DUF4070 domain-containing protein [Dehalogenimonas etheniformans]QNT75966.1 B12-binding domain-containing radical SAM protein [Dehalogenimonas etheniformans]